MKKVALAVGHRQLEEFLESKLRNEFQFVGVTVYREGIIRSISQTAPDIVVIRETLDGKENIMDIVYEIQVQFPHIRVVFIAGDRAHGDALLSTLVSYGVYDILHGSKVSAPEIMRLIRQPNTRKDVAYLQPKPMLDEQKNKLLFDSPEFAPSERVIIKEVVREVFVDPDGDIVDRQSPLESSPVQRAISNQPAHSLEPEDLETFEENPFEEEEKSEEKVPEIKSKPEEEEKKERRRGVLPTFRPKSEPKPRAQVEEPKKPEKKRNKKRDEGITLPSFGTSKDGGTLLTFMGAKHGVGTTSIGISVATALAEKKKVLYVEMNEVSPATPYWYEISKLTEGIDTALYAVDLERYQDINKSIVRMAQLKKNSSMQKVHKRFPDNLDFLTFSKRYVSRKEGEFEEVDYELTKDLYLYLLFQSDYDYIVLDVGPNMSHPAVQFALMYSHRIFYFLTQDVSVMGQADFMLHELEKNGQDIRKKTQFLLNRYENSSLGLKSVEKWLNIQGVITIPNANKEFIHASFNGIPMFYHGRSSAWRSTWKNILKTI